MNNEEFMAKIARVPEVSLSLFNEDGEYHRADSIKTLTRTNKGIKIRWEVTEPFTQVMPFTHVVLHKGKTIWNVLAIRPIASDVQPTELELEYDY